MAERWQRIVVGVSGSESSRAALAWAAGEARFRHARLHVVHVWDPARQHAPYALHGAGPDRQRQLAAGRLATALRAAAAAATPGTVTAELAEGVPERVLVQRSAGADLLVLGAATPASQVPPYTGPVVRACLAHAACPVVIIRTASHARSADPPAQAVGPLVPGRPARADRRPAAPGHNSVPCGVPTGGPRPVRADRGQPHGDQAHARLDSRAATRRLRW